MTGLADQVVLCCAWIYLVATLAGASRKPVVGAVLAASLPVVLGFFLAFGVVDDAFISLRYARNFALDHGLVWNVGERVEGYTSLSWVVLLGLFDKLGVSGLPLLAPALAVAASAAAFVLVYRLSARMMPPGAGAPRAAAMVVLGAHFPTAFWAYAGMETGLALLLLLGANLRFWSWRERGELRALTHSSALLALGSATRPEVALVWAMHLPFILRPAAGRASSLGQRALRFVVPFVLVQAGLLAFRIAYYGRALPNTYYAKVGTPFSHAAFGLEYLGGGLVAHALVALSAVAGLLGGFRGSPAVRYLATMALSWALIVLITGADHFAEWRYFVFLWPYLFMLALPVLEALAQRACAFTSPESTLGRLLRTQVVAVFAAAVFAWNFAYGGIGSRTLTGVGRVEAERWAELGRWLDAVAPKDAVVAAPTIGAIGYYGRRTTIDMVGLTDAHIARSRTLAGSPKDHEHFDTEYLLSRKPDYIYLTTHYGSEAAFLRARHWLPAVRDLKRYFPNPDYEFIYVQGKLDGYDLYRRKRPEAGGPPHAVRTPRAPCPCPEVAAGAASRGLADARFSAVVPRRR